MEAGHSVKCFIFWKGHNAAEILICALISINLEMLLIVNIPGEEEGFT